MIERSLLIKDSLSSLGILEKRYNYLADYALLALFIDENGKKNVPLEQVEALKCYMQEELSKQNHCDRDYEYCDYNFYYLAHTDMLDVVGGNKYLPDSFQLKEGFTTFDLARRIIYSFDKKQLSTVLPSDVVELLLSLVPQEEVKGKSKIS